MLCTIILAALTSRWSSEACSTRSAEVSATFAESGFPSFSVARTLYLTA